MGLQLAKLVVTIAAGGSIGSGTFSQCPAGYLEELYLDYGQTNGGTNVSIAEAGHNQPILAVSNNQTDGTYYPRATACNASGTGLGSDGAVPIAIASPLTVSVTGGNPATAALTVYAKVRTL